MFKISSVGKKLYFSVLTVFFVFAVSFIVFQQSREKQFKINTLTLKLANYNELLMEDLLLSNSQGILLSDSVDMVDSVRVAEAKLQEFVREHESKDLRVTLVKPDGRVVFDNMSKNYRHFANHAKREEIAEALKVGQGTSVERQSKTLKQDYFYVASYFPKAQLIVRTALPYNDDLTKSLQADQHYIWFAIVAIILLTVVLYRFTYRLGKNVSKLTIFAYKADHNESLEVEDLANFPDDELGEIAERIIKMYKRVQTTRKEQDILKRQLTQNIAHELKTPVASIQGYLETILDNPHINEQTKEQFLQRCYAQSERLTSLLHDISTLNRLDDGSDMIDFEAVDITQMVADITKETALVRQERKMTFDNQLPERIVVKGNRSLLYSVFRNLTDNAIAYAGEGRTITLEAKEQGNKWHFIFRDNGQGVPPEHLARLFERFYRVDKGRSRKMGGTGLGLAIVKNAVLLHGGTIRVSNLPEGGLKFEFTIKK
uniref:sensor histidine kinase n=1 Tax=Prevotella sp. TaxID=59823 RepID=UPI0040251CD0